MSSTPIEAANRGKFPLTALTEKLSNDHEHH
jgi:hypothetical protein